MDRTTLKNGGYAGRLAAIVPGQKPSALVAFVAGHNQRWQEAITTLLPHIGLIITGLF